MDPLVLLENTILLYWSGWWYMINGKSVSWIVISTLSDRNLLWHQLKQQSHCPHSQGLCGPGQGGNLNPRSVWVSGIAGDWVPWDPGRRLYNAAFHIHTSFCERFTTPVGQWARGPPHPARGWRGKWLAACTKIDFPLSPSKSLQVVTGRVPIQPQQARQSTLLCFLLWSNQSY